MTDQKIIELIKSNSYSKALNKLYKNFPHVLAYVLKSGGKKQDAEDIFQDSLLICIEKIKDDDFILTSSLSTFMVGIAKNKTREHLRIANRFVASEEDELQLEETDIGELLEQENKFRTVNKVLMEVGKKCMDLLIMFYHKGMNMSQIASKLGFKSETSAKTQKYKCLEKAKKLTSGVLIEIQNTGL